MFEYYTSILILCWMALGTMCILVHENNRIPRDNKRYLYLTYVLVACSALAEWFGIRLDGNTNIPSWVLMIVKCIDYILSPAAGGVLVLQMHLRNRWDKVIKIILIANTILQLMAVPTEWMIYIDEHNHYFHGPLFPVYEGICLAIMALIIVQFIFYGETFKRRNRFSIYATMFIVMTSFFIQLLLTGYRTVYVGMTLATALTFIHYVEFSQLAADETMAEQGIQLMLSQIKPHFLYNTLGSIEALCERDPKAAKLATRKFSKYLRGNMDSLSDEKLIHFEKELQHTKLFLELQQIRFGDSLQVAYDIQASNFYLPPLTLEPIVENAVRHGVRMNADGRGTVKIISKETADEYILQVIDDGPGFVPSDISQDETHIGIKNVTERLERICDGSLTIYSAPEGGAVATIRLPKELRM